MSGMSRPAAVKELEETLLAAPGRDVAVTVAVLAVTAVVFAAVADHAVLVHIQRADDAWLRLMVSGRSAPVTAVAKFFNLLGLVYVTLPVRIAIAGFLALRRRWWHLAAFVAAVVLSEVLIGTLKGAYDRTRPPGSLVATSGASFPSGHSIAASVTVVAAVIALVPAGRRRVAWGAAAVGFSVLMAASRAYLGAHWLSDAIAGILLGTSCALLAALVVNELQRRRGARQPDRPVRPPVLDTARGQTGDERASGRRLGGAPPPGLALPSPGRRDPPDLGELLGPAAPVAGGLGSGPASRVPTGIVQVACVAATVLR
jgi:membrane-associated phospholipid phosphatase